MGAVIHVESAQTGDVRSRTGWLAGLVVGVGMFVVSAGPASAIMVKLPHAGYANYASIAGAKAPKAARIFDAAFTNLDYSGGPVMPSNTNYTVAWQPSNYGSHTPFQSGYVLGVDQYFADLAAASGQPSNADAVATQFNDVFGHTAAYSSFNGGTLTDTNPLPANGCPAAAGHICLNDTQLQTELNSFLASQGVTADLAHEYYLLTPPDVASCFDAAGSACSANADVNQKLCAYHGQTSASYVYSNIPDLAGVNGCDPFVTSCPNSSCQYDNGPADGVLSAISHEHVESITDPQPNTAWTDWGSNVGGKIGDKCNNDALNDPKLVPQDDGHGTGTPYNQSINGSHYLLQREWSNQTTQYRTNPGPVNSDLPDPHQPRLATQAQDRHEQLADRGLVPTTELRDRRVIRHRQRRDHLERHIPTTRPLDLPGGPDPDRIRLQK